MTERDTNPTNAVLEMTGDQGVDVVLDHVAGETFALTLPATKVDGHVVDIGRLTGPASNIDLDALSYRHFTAHGVSFGFSRDWETVPILEALAGKVLQAVATGDVSPIIDSTYNVDNLDEATARLRSGEAVGKVVLIFV